MVVIRAASSITREREKKTWLSLLVTPPPGQQQHSAGAPSYMGAPLAVIMVLMFAAGVTAAYHYGLLGFAAQDLFDSIHAIARR